MARPNTVDLLPCPFCGGEAGFERLGSMRQSCIVACSQCGARLETGEVFKCGTAWNQRHRVPAGEG